jgi:hypothetical protein
MLHQLSYVGNVVLAVALIISLFFVCNPFENTGQREAEEYQRQLSAQNAEWEAKQRALDEEFERKRLESRARIAALEAEARDLERKFQEK